MGFTIAYFYSLTPRQFFNVYKGWRKRQHEVYKTESERMRLLMWAALAPHQAKGAKLTPEQLLTFPWEEPQADALPELSPEQLTAAAIEMRDFWDKTDAKLAKVKTPPQKLTLSQLLRDKTT